MCVWLVVCRMHVCTGIGSQRVEDDEVAVLFFIFILLEHILNVLREKSV